MAEPALHRRKDGVAGLLVGLLAATAIHLLLLPALGALMGSGGGDGSKKGTQLVRLSSAQFEKHRRIELEVKDAKSRADAEKKKKAKLDDDEVDAPGQVVSLPRPEKAERPLTADHAAEHDQRADHETRSRDQRSDLPAIARRLTEGKLGEIPTTSARAPDAPGAQPAPAAGPLGPGRAASGDSGTDTADGGGERMFALEIPRQAAREPLQLKMDVDGLLRNRTAVPEIPGTGDTARIAIGNAPADKARRSGSDGASSETGQGLRGGGNGSAGLPNLEQLTPAPADILRIAGAPAADYLPEVEVDAETRLNAWRWKHATFFNRIYDRIVRVWQGGQVLSKNDPAGNVYGFEDRMTVVQVTLDRNGNVLDVDVQEPSGALVLDDEAVRAFREAGPFANPPAQLFRGKDQFTFLFGFNVSYDRSNFDLNWRPN